MFYALILLSFLSFSAQAMEEQPVKVREVGKEPVILWALHKVLLRPKDNIPLLPSRLTPETLEEDLLDAVRSTAYENEEAAQHPGKLPTGFKAWSLDHVPGKTMQELAKQGTDHVAQQKSWYVKPIFKLAFPIVITNAFTPEKSVSYLKPISEIIALVQACQQQGCQTALATNRNSEDFAEIEKQHPDVVNLFEHRFTSGQPNQPGTSTKLQLLTSEPAFFEKIMEKMGGGRTYFYIDIEDGKESLDAAKDAGVTPISVPVGNDKEKATALKLKLVEHNLLPE